MEEHSLKVDQTQRLIVEQSGGGEKPQRNERQRSGYSAHRRAGLRNQEENHRHQRDQIGLPNRWREKGGSVEGQTRCQEQRLPLLRSAQSPNGNGSPTDVSGTDDA